MSKRLSDIVEWDTPEGSVVWTAPGGQVMIQRIEPGNLSPDEADELARALREAAQVSRDG